MYITCIYLYKNQRLTTLHSNGEIQRRQEKKRKKLQNVCCWVIYLYFYVCSCEWKVLTFWLIKLFWKMSTLLLTQLHVIFELKLTLPLSTNASSFNVRPMLTNRSGIKSDQSLLRNNNQLNNKIKQRKQNRLKNRLSSLII